MSFPEEGYQFSIIFLAVGYSNAVAHLSTFSHDGHLLLPHSIQAPNKSATLPSLYNIKVCLLNAYITEASLFS